MKNLKRRRCSPSGIAELIIEDGALSSTTDENLIEIPEKMVSGFSFGENETGVIMFFDTEIIAAGLAAVNAAVAPPIPAWLVGGAYPVTTQQFKNGVMQYLATVTNGGVQHGSILAPNTIQEYGRVASLIGSLCSDAFVLAIANAAGLALAQVVIVVDGARPVTGRAADIFAVGFPALGVQAFV